MPFRSELAESVFQWVSQSTRCDGWRRFRLPVENTARLLRLAGDLGFHIAERRRGSDVEIFEVRDAAQWLCVGERSSKTPSVFAFHSTAYAVAVADNREAAAEYDRWTGVEISGETHHASGSDRVLAFDHLLKAEEAAQWRELECHVARAGSPEFGLDLEGEVLFEALADLIETVISPAAMSLHLETPGDFWPNRDHGWVWVHPESSKEMLDLTLTPPAMRLLQRRERTLHVDDFGAVADLFASPPGAALVDGVALFLPLSFRSSRIGMLTLWFSAPRVLLPQEVEIIEMFRRRLSALLDRSRLYLRTQRMAVLDGLTSLFNHRFFREQLRTEYRRAQRYQKKMSLIMIDIDDFKSYNDTYGHLAGDRVLVDVAKTIRGTVRDIDFVARYGGEEFALILPEVNAESGMIVAEKIRMAIEDQRFELDDGETVGCITVSCGVTDNQEAAAPEDLISRADQALYWVKRHGRNLVRLAPRETA